MQKLTEGLMKKMLKSAVAGETILYTCYHETSLKRAMKLAYKVINKFGYKYHHPSASPVGFDGATTTTFPISFMTDISVLNPGADIPSSFVTKIKGFSVMIKF